MESSGETPVAAATTGEDKPQPPPRPRSLSGGPGGGQAGEEPLFGLLEELFESRSRLRKTLVSFVQITYGRNISRHARELAGALLSEEVLAKCVEEVTTSVWGGGREGEDGGSAAALEALLQCVPEHLARLVGERNAARGVERLFVTLQHHGLNKGLLYNLLDELLQELFPELKNFMTLA